MGEIIGDLNAALEAIKGFVAQLATDVVLDTTPAGWACQGLDKLAGTSCADKVDTIGTQAAEMAIDVGLAAYGIPPTIPDPVALINIGADYMAATALDTAMSSAGVSLDDVPGAQDYLQQQISSQVKSNSAVMTLKSNLETIKVSDRSKGNWYAEPLCEQVRLAGSYSGWVTPHATVYVKVTRQSAYAGSNKNWKFKIASAENGVWAAKTVTIPSRWPQNLDSMIIPVDIEADFAYWEALALPNISETDAWYAYKWNSAHGTFKFSIDLFDASVQSTSSNSFSCEKRLGIGCAPVPNFSEVQTIGVKSGIGNDPTLTRDCTLDELAAVANDPSPF